MLTSVHKPAINESQDFEELLELNHEDPVRLLELVPEVVLAGVDRLPADL